MIPPTTVLSELNNAAKEGQGRKKSHKQHIKEFLIGRSSKFPKSVIDAAKGLNGTELKSIINEWAQEGSNQ